MKYRYSLLFVALLGVRASAQPPTAPLDPTGVTFLSAAAVDGPSVMLSEDGSGRNGLSGSHDFGNFIGFLSNPLQNIDPRAINELYPIFGSVSTSEAGPVPKSDTQLYGAGLTVALSDRFSFGLNQGGYANVQLSTQNRALLNQIPHAGPAACAHSASPGSPSPCSSCSETAVSTSAIFNRWCVSSIRIRWAKLSGVEAGGDRSGWLNLGGFFQYTLIQDVPDQFLLTAGLRPGKPPADRTTSSRTGPAPPVTVGKEFGNFHLLVTTGYYFPAGPGSDTSQLFYADIHLDRQMFGWLYPLVEFNSIYHTTSVSLDLPARCGSNLDNFESSGNIVTMAVGANAVIVRERLEFGAVYLTSLASHAILRSMD